MMNREIQNCLLVTTKEVPPQSVRFIHSKIEFDDLDKLTQMMSFALKKERGLFLTDIHINQNDGSESFYPDRYLWDILLEYDRPFSGKN